VVLVPAAERAAGSPAEQQRDLRETAPARALPEAVAPERRVVDWRTWAGSSHHQRYFRRGRTVTNTRWRMPGWQCRGRASVGHEKRCRHAWYSFAFRSLQLRDEMTVSARESYRPLRTVAISERPMAPAWAMPASNRSLAWPFLHGDAGRSLLCITNKENLRRETQTRFRKSSHAAKILFVSNTERRINHGLRIKRMGDFYPCPSMAQSVHFFAPLEDS
jgi:hypothetical protein